MKLLYENKTKYSNDLYLKYCEFHNKTYNFTSNLYSIIIVFLILFCFVSQINAHNYTLLFVFGCSFTAFVLWRFLHPIYNTNKELKNPVIANNEYFVFRFYDKIFTIESNSEIIEMKYSQIYRVFITSEFTYIYSDRTHAFILQNDCFIKDNFDNFKNFFKKKCLFKFYKK